MALSYLVERDARGISSMDSMTKLWNSIFFNRQGMEIKHLLIRYDHVGCIDDRDRVFANMRVTASGSEIVTEYAETDKQSYNRFVAAYLTAKWLKYDLK
jgi:hypothetical protein